MLRFFVSLLVATGVASAASPVTGEWHGAIMKLRVVVKLEQSAEGIFSGTLHSLEQGKSSIPFTAVTFEADVLNLELTSIQASFEGKFNSPTEEIVGIWKQGGSSIPLILRRPDGQAKSSYRPHTRGSVALTPCRASDGNTEGICGTYDVFENRQTKAGRKIALRIMILPSDAAKPAPDPFVALAGGPGQSAVDAYPPAPLIGQMRKTRDILLVDQRGTGKSNRLECELRNSRSAQAVVDGDRDVEKIKGCRTELEKIADLTQYTTSIAADDLDDIRAALGYAKINVYGGSYGTKAALEYVRRHGQHVRTLSLRGVAPTQYKLPLPFARTIDESMKGLFEDCAKDEGCNKSFPDLKKEYRVILERLDKEPAQFEVFNQVVKEKQQVTMTKGAFVSNLRIMLYMPQIVASLPFLIHRIHSGDWLTFSQTLLALIPAIDPGIARGMFFSVVCAEDVPFITDEEVKKETADTDLGDYQVRTYRSYCEVWPRGKAAEDFTKPVQSDVPTLLVAGERDSATPPSDARDAARTLSKSRVVAIAAATHGTSSPCIDQMFSSFVNRGSVSDVDASCAEKMTLPRFLTLQRVDGLNLRAQ